MKSRRFTLRKNKEGTDDEHRRVRGNDPHPRSGDPSIDHAVAVARTIARYGPDAVADLALPATRAGEGPGLNLPPEPVKGWKVVGYELDPDGTITFIGYGDRGYGVEASSKCREFGHVVPPLSCSCGFYAFDNYSRAAANLSPARPALLEVELFGTVHVHAHGYRAQHQRVLSVMALQPTCLVATGATSTGHTKFCDQPAAWVITRTDESVCGRHALMQPHRFHEVNLTEPINCETEFSFMKHRALRQPGERRAGTRGQWMIVP